MDYAAHYRWLIERARQRVLTGYVERHHVLPRCLGGDDSAENRVRLTPEEHYVAHQLLVKMHPKNHRLIWAAVAMTNRTKRQRRGNKLYRWLRRALAAYLSTRVMTEETRAKLRRPKRRRPVRKPHSAETRAKMSIAAMGREKSSAHRAALSAAKMGRKRGPHSEQHRQNIAQALRCSDALKTAVRRFSKDPEYRAKQSRIAKAWARRKAAGELARHSSELPVGG